MYWFWVGLAYVGGIFTGIALHALITWVRDNDVLELTMEDFDD